MNLKQKTKKRKLGLVCVRNVLCFAMTIDYNIRNNNKAVGSFVSSIVFFCGFVPECYEKHAINISAESDGE